MRTAWTKGSDYPKQTDCINIYNSREVIEIRLGETDLTTTLDCLDLDTNCPFNSEEECLRKSQCAEEHVVRKLARKIIRPRYNSANSVTFINGYFTSKPCFSVSRIMMLAS